MKFTIPKYEIELSDNARQISYKFYPPAARQHKQYFQEFDFDTEVYWRALGCTLPARISDLLNIASSVYLADRLALRCPPDWSNFQRRPWKRKLNLVIPVRELSFWQRPAILEHLTETLEFATEDRWNLIFKSFCTIKKPLQSTLDFKLPDNIFVGLFSGGLDAFAGTFDYLRKHRPDRAYLISVVTNRRMKGVLRQQINELKKELRLDIVYVPIRIHFRERMLPDYLEEKTQRSRGFLYTLLGSILAHLSSRSKLHLFENGIGALNLPMVDSQIGTDNTRATNPITLLKISKLLSFVFDKPFEIENKALWLTKGEMCKVLIDTPLKDKVSDTVSCDGSFSRRVRRKRQCGLCTSCLLRRQSLTAAGLADNDFADDYQFDIFKASSIESAGRLFAYKAMQKQIHKIGTCLNAPRPWYELSLAYPSLEEIKLQLSGISHKKMPSLQKNIMRLYGAYLYEWHLFENRVN